MLASLLLEHGIKDAIVSPGSRNAPLLIALERQSGINTRVVIDERSAAFIALGLSEGTGRPVALVCTSGTAPLNYAPALAEAFYRQIPLIAITADRPEEWIDQDDSQTIIQPGIYSNYIKGTYDIPVESDDTNRMWMINRKLNDAVLLASSGVPGPVHLNIRLDEPLGEIVEVSDERPRVVSRVDSFDWNCGNYCDFNDLSRKKIMILCGFMHKNHLSEQLKKAAALPNVIVLHEAQSNLSSTQSFIPNIDGTITRLDNAERPDIVITLGGSLTSRMIKAYLRACNGLEHWSVGLRNHSVDSFKKLTRRIECDEETFLKHFVNGISSTRYDIPEFKSKWHFASRKALSDAARYAAIVPWSDFKAAEYIINKLPKGWNLQLSNGTSVRYAQLFDYSSAASIHCNRGVSGIDGCTSTAIGSAIAHTAPTVLLTGDMSMQYDIGALATTFIPDSFKIIVLNNGGGGIFRFIPSTGHLPELEKYFVGDVRLPLEKLAEAYGYHYLSATKMDELEDAYSELICHSSSPVILEVKTDGALSAEILKTYLSNS